MADEEINDGNNPKNLTPTEEASPDETANTSEDKARISSPSRSNHDMPNSEKTLDERVREDYHDSKHDVRKAKHTYHGAKAVDKNLLGGRVGNAIKGSKAGQTYQNAYDTVANHPTVKPVTDFIKNVKDWNIFRPWGSGAKPTTTPPPPPPPPVGTPPPPPPPVGVASGGGGALVDAGGNALADAAVGGAAADAVGTGAVGTTAVAGGEGALFTIFGISITAETGGIILLVVIALIIIGIVLMLLFVAVNYFSMANSGNSSATSTDSATDIVALNSSGKLIFEDPSELTRIQNNEVNTQLLSIIDNLASQHDYMKITVDDKNLSFSITESDTIKCVDTNNNKVSIPLKLDGSFSLSGITPAPVGDSKCALNYFPGIESAAEGPYFEYFNKGEFNLSQYSAYSNSIIQEKLTELENESISSIAESDNTTSSLTQEIIVKSPFLSRNISGKTPTPPAPYEIFSDIYSPDQLKAISEGSTAQTLTIKLSP